MQEVADTVQTCTFFVVGADDDPRRVAGVGVEEHGVFGFGVVVPAVERLDIHWRQFPVFQRVVTTGDEATELFFTGYGEPEFEQMDAAGNKHTFQFRGLTHEEQVFVRFAEAHYAFYAGTVVP